MIRQLTAGLAFCGLLLFGAPTLFGAMEYVDAWRQGSGYEITGFVPFGVIPTAVFAAVFLVAMHGNWSCLFRRKKTQGKANNVLEDIVANAPNPQD